MRRLRDRVALVTGAGSGIGRALSLGLAAKGCDLALADVDVGALTRVAEEVRGLGRKASVHEVDVASRRVMEALPAEVLEQHGHVHIVVNNAGVTIVGPLEEQAIEDMEWILGINLWGVIYGCRFFLPHLRREEEGHIVNLSSVFGIIGVPTQAMYNVTKFGVRGLSEALLAELAGSSIGVSVVHPGGIQTNIVASSRISPDQDRAELQQAFDRFGMTPEKAAARIIRAIEKNQHRVRISRETYLLDWAKRLFPVWTQKAIGAGYRRNSAR